MRFSTMGYARPAKAQTSLNIRSMVRAFASRLNILTVELLSEQNLEFIILKGGCTGLSESKLVKIPHCLKSYDC